MPRPTLFGVLCLGVLLGGLVMTAVFTGGPRRSAANPDDSPRAPIQPPRSIDWEQGVAAEERVLCELVGREFRVRVLAATDEPRYTVMSLDGQVLLERGTVSEVAAAFPTLDLENLKDAEGNAYGPLMLMDSDTMDAGK